MSRLPELHEQVLAWYPAHARDLPWRDASASPWAVLVSEFMLQQTPVARVLPVYQQWMREWPSPSTLASARKADAIRAWGRLGYPRRALRLHDTATAIVARHGGEVPTSVESLRALPGVGEYTAAAVSAFAFRQRHAVLDTNVRRVLARVVSGVEFPGRSTTSSERVLATDLLPAEPPTAAAWSVAVMELGAIVCTATSPRCRICPIASDCAWRTLGYPEYDGPPRRGQTYAGTDRQCRGALLEVLRHADGAVHRSRLAAAWHDAEQTKRCLLGLLDDGLAVASPGHTYALP